MTCGWRTWSYCSDLSSSWILLHEMRGLEIDDLFQDLEGDSERKVDEGSNVYDERVLVYVCLKIR